MASVEGLGKREETNFVQPTEESIGDRRDEGMQVQAGEDDRDVARLRVREVARRRRFET